MDEEPDPLHVDVSWTLDDALAEILDEAEWVDPVPQYEDIIAAWPSCPDLHPTGYFTRKFMPHIDVEASIAFARAEDPDFTDLEAEAFRRFLSGEITKKQASVFIAESMGAQYQDRGDLMPRPVSDAISRFLMAIVFYVLDTDGRRGRATLNPIDQVIEQVAAIQPPTAEDEAAMTRVLTGETIVEQEVEQVLAELASARGGPIPLARSSTATCWA